MKPSLQSYFAPVALIALLSGTAACTKQKETSPALAEKMPDAPAQKTAAQESPRQKKMREDDETLRLVRMRIINEFWKNGTKDPALIEAAMIFKGEGDETVQFLLDAGANPNYVSGGYTALMWAAYNGNTKSVKALLKAGADPNFAPEKDSVRPLCDAAKTGDAESVKALLAAGADINGFSYGQNFTALHGATTHANPDMVRLLLQAGADPSFRAEGDRTAAEMAESAASYTRSFRDSEDGRRIMTEPDSPMPAEEVTGYIKRYEEAAAILRNVNNAQKPAPSGQHIGL